MSELNIASIFFTGAIMGCLSGVGIGMALSWGSLERYYNLLLGVDKMLKDFKAEGVDGKWLK